MQTWRQGVGGTGAEPEFLQGSLALAPTVAAVRQSRGPGEASAGELVILGLRQDPGTVHLRVGSASPLSPSVVTGYRVNGGARS